MDRIACLQVDRVDLCIPLLFALPSSQCLIEITFSTACLDVVDAVVKLMESLKEKSDSYVSSRTCAPVPSPTV